LGLFGILFINITPAYLSIKNLKLPYYAGVPTSDIALAYREADFFAFPSLEEGSPLVTYEAMANCLPVLTSPMGAGGVARDGKDGIIVSPYDEEALVTGLQQLAGCAELRLRMSDSARERAQEFTWEKVARRRAQLVLERLKPA
jgi:glycosyltransferase involved in cell wall biosynthesis